MICSTLINQSDLQDICQYKLMLREILLNDASTKTKIALVNSFKSHLTLTLKNRLKRQEEQPLTADKYCFQNHSKLIDSSIGPSVNVESQQRSAALQMAYYHRGLMDLICSQYQQRNYLSITLQDLQKQLDRANSKYLKCYRSNDFNGAAKAIESIKQAQLKMRRVLQSLRQKVQSTAVKYEMVKDNINVLKVKYSIVKNYLLKSNVQTTKPKKVKIPTLMLKDENKNQILVNL